MKKLKFSIAPYDGMLEAYFHNGDDNGSYTIFQSDYEEENPKFKVTYIFRDKDDLIDYGDVGIFEDLYKALYTANKHYNNNYHD